MNAPEAPPLPAELDALLERMRLPYFHRAPPEVCAIARAQRWEPAEVLRVLLAEEVKGRDTATRSIRRGLPASPPARPWRAGGPTAPPFPSPLNGP